MLVVLMIIHGFGLDRIIARYKRRGARLKKLRRNPDTAVLLFASTIFLMLMLHSFEVWLWAFLLYGGGLVADMHRSVYFSANAYTTLGMGSMVLPQTWHEMSPMMAISGLFAFAWTTSEMFNIVGDQHDLMASLAKEREEEQQ